MSTPSRNVFGQPDVANTVPPGFVQPPTWCNTSGGFTIDRTDSCGVFGGSLVYTNITTHQILATIQFNFTDYAFTSTNIGNFDQEGIVSPVTISGPAAASISVRGHFSCNANCSLTQSDFPSQVIGTGGNGYGIGEFSTTIAARGTSGSTTPTAFFSFTAPGAAPSNPLSQSQLAIRCDNAIPGISYVGCVFPQDSPVMTYRLSGLYPQLANHINEAQASGLPGSLNSAIPLTRTTIQANIDANRSVGCPNSYPRPLGDSCDEYPFASTYQGAAFATAGPRTFPGCSIALSNPGPPTGSVGYSVCMINANQNSQGGSALNSRVYVPDRVINGDAFYVDITS